MEKYNFVDLKQNLESKGYQVSVFEKKEDAAIYINGQVNQKSIGLGGSVTIHEMNLFEILSSHNVVYWHDKKPDDMTIMETRTAASRAEVYISSVNAISEAGEIVNIDNTGNRVAAISYGPAKIYLVIGSNKVTADLELAEKLNVSDKTVSKWETAKGYPEGNAEGRFKINGVKKIVFYCKRDGLFFINIVKGIDDKETAYDDIKERRKLEETAKKLFR